MVTQDQLRDLLGRRPFQPFRITLNDGEELRVIRTNQAVAMRRRIIFVTPEDRTRWIWFEQVQQVQPLESSAA